MKNKPSNNEVKEFVPIFQVLVDNLNTRDSGHGWSLKVPEYGNQFSFVSADEVQEIRLDLYKTASNFKIEIGIAWYLLYRVGHRYHKEGLLNGTTLLLSNKPIQAVVDVVLALLPAYRQAIAEEQAAIKVEQELEAEGDAYMKRYNDLVGDPGLIESRMEVCVRGPESLPVEMSIVPKVRRRNGEYDRRVKLTLHNLPTELADQLILFVLQQFGKARRSEGAPMQEEV